ncbi:MAG: DEAD/DEAH box helicase [Planctomycetota bacterium]|jgi:ATP-dependent RNA helicase DeaD
MPVVEPEDALPELSLADLPETMQRAAARAGWSELMPVQARSMPYVLAGRDLMIQSRTGSGKTGAFILPMLERIDPKMRETQALVLVPTRELARQVEKEAAMLAGKDGVRTVAVYGGVRYGEQLKAFKQGAHLVVGTPGRILDHLLRRSLSLQSLDMLVFDEADRMLSMGFYPDMRRLQEFLPRRRIHAFMFSATFPANVIGLADQFLHEPETLSLSTDHVHVTDTEHVMYKVDAMTRDRALMRIIEVENPASAIIFCRRKTKVDYISDLLQNFGYDADQLSADLPQNAREKVLERLAKGELKFLVATDVAARGIDIRNLSHVIQFEPPEDPEAYIHRAGRTGRAGATGEALTLASGVEEIEMKRISERFGFEILERELPSDEDVAAVVSERVTALLEADLRQRRSLARERMKRFEQLAKSLGELDDVMAMLIDDYYHKSLHAPQVPPEPKPDRRDRERERGESREGRQGGGRRRRRR